MTREYGCRPSGSQEVLLQAVLLDGDEAAAAQRTWLDRIDIEKLDAGSLRLLPLLYRRLRVDAGAERIGRIRGVYRQTWYRNQLIIGHVSQVLGALQQAGIETLVLKGVPLALRYYDRMAERPMADADVLVPAGRAAEAYAVVRSSGWTLRDPRDEWPPLFTASRAFGNALGLEMDLHCHVLHECLDADADEEFWARAAACEVGGVCTSMLAPSDQLLHVLTHGYRRNPVAPLRWVVDASMIVRAEPRLDWGCLVEQCRSRRLTRMVSEGLRYLAARRFAAIPEEVLGAFGEIAVSPGEAMEAWSRVTPTLPRLAVEKWCEYRRASGLGDRWSGAFGFARYLRDRLRVDSPWQVPFAAARHVAQRLT